MFERDPLFQLNVIIWASLPLPAGLPYHAVLHAAGYCFDSMERPLPASPRETNAVSQIGRPVRLSPIADVVLRADAVNRLAIVECKAQAFGMDTNGDGVIQAGGYIFAAGNIHQRLAVAGSPEGLVCYVVPDDQRHLMAETLRTISDELQATGLGPLGRATVLGLSVRGDGTWLSPEVVHEDGDTLLPEAALVLEETSDPRPLYIVPWHPDSPAETDRRAFASKTKSHLIANVNTAALGSATVVLFDELLFEMSRGVYRKADPAALRRVRAELRSIVTKLVDGSRLVEVTADRTTFTLTTESDRESLVEQIRSSRVLGSDAQGFQSPMGLPDTSR